MTSILLRNLKKALLIGSSIILLLVFIYGKIQWDASGHTLLDSWNAAAKADWLVSITLVDGGIFALICLMWMINDVREQPLNIVLKVAFVLLTLVIGAPGFLMYLAVRQKSLLCRDLN